MDKVKSDHDRDEQGEQTSASPPTLNRVPVGVEAVDLQDSTSANLDLGSRSESNKDIVAAENNTPAADKDDGYNSQAEVTDLIDDHLIDLMADTEVVDKAEDLDLEDTSQLDSDGRNKLFQRGLSFDKQKKRNCALKCYMGCLKGLQKDSKFTLLPQCLRNIADIFYHKEEFDKAVHFIQAEKVYYESALIDTEEIQRRLEEAQKATEDGSILTNQNTDTVRADEYEHLARLCLDREQPQLALEYAGKATKLRQQLLGDGHLVTQQSLDFFATVYAKVGAEQYQDSLEKFSTPTSESNNNDNSNVNNTNEPVSILRKRKPETEKRVRFNESSSISQQNTNQEELISKTVLWFLLTMCCVLMLLLGAYLFCHVRTNQATCQTIRTNLHYSFMKLKYYYYHYTASNSGTNSKYT